MDSHKLMYLLGIFYNTTCNLLWAAKRMHYINTFLVLMFNPYFSYSLVFHTMNILINLPTFKDRLIGEQKAIECLNMMRLIVYITLLIDIGISASLDRVLMADFILILTKFYYMNM